MVDTHDITTLLNLTRSGSDKWLDERFPDNLKEVSLSSTVEEKQIQSDRVGPPILLS